MWVHTKAKLKLDACAVEGRWVGYDKQSKGSRIYWPEKGSVTVERIIIFTHMVGVDDLEGEDKVSSKNSSTSDDLTSDELPKDVKLKNCCINCLSQARLVQEEWLSFTCCLWEYFLTTTYVSQHQIQ